MAKQKYIVTYAAGAYLNNYFYPEGSIVVLDIKPGQRVPLWARPCDDAGVPLGLGVPEEVHTIDQKLGDALGNKMAAAAGEPAAPEQTPEPVTALDETKTAQILEALKLLDHADDAHWTKQGHPNINVLVETLGFKITKADLAVAAPDFVRHAVQTA